MTDFVSLHNHTHYSLLDSLNLPKDLFYRAKELNQKALAITDHGTLAGIFESLKYSRETGVKLIAGCEMYFLDDVKNTNQKFRHVILLAKNAIGYKNLLLLNKYGFDNNIIFAKRIYPLIDWNLLENHSEGLICLTSCSNGIIAQLLMNKKNEEAEEQLIRLHNIFGDNLGLEVQANNLRKNVSMYNDQIEQMFINRQIINLSKKHNIRCVATVNCHYLKKEDAETHDILLAIGSHQPIYSNNRLKYDSHDFYLKTGDEVKAFFERSYPDYAQTLCDNSVYFANLCEFPDWIEPKYSNSGKELPIFPVHDELDYDEFLKWKSNQVISNEKEDDLYLKYKCFQSFEEKRKENPEYCLNEQIYIDRINKELDVLKFQGFSSYMLIVADYIGWAKRNGISVGPGRGSAGGSFTAYLLGIHVTDSIKYGLIFERFQNKERTEAPDVDSDFASKDRDKVVEYIYSKYGKDNVCSISNFNKITPKVYVRDLCRALELGGDTKASTALGNDLAALLPPELKGDDFEGDFDEDLETVLKKAPLFAEYCKKYPQLLKHASILGKFRASSTHAGAIVIGKRPLVGLVPLRKDKDGDQLIEYEKYQTEENGLIKMDILRVSNLDTINNTIALIKENNKSFNNEHMRYDDNDEKTYNLISSGNTFGIFQFGASGAMEMCKKVKPKNIQDLAIITTLIRPAAKDIREAFIATREGRQKFNLLHPSLKNAFESTYGFGLFDESILQLGQDVAGWSLNSADRIRKMIKEKGKYPEKAKKLKEEFIEGAYINNNIPKEMGERIWEEEVKKFAGYTFNKSHAIAYSLLSYQTAYLKAHFPEEFLLANLMKEVNSNSPNSDNNILLIKNELKNLGYKILGPNINTSQMSFTLNNNVLLTGLDALKSVGDDAIKDILDKRPFKDFFDFMLRVTSKHVRGNTIQALAASGALDSFNIDRKLIYLYTSDYRLKLRNWLKTHDPEKEQFIYPWPTEGDLAKPWTKAELYALEKHYLGQAFICGKYDAYGNFFKTNEILINNILKLKNKDYLPSFKCELKSFFEFKIKKEGKYYGLPMIKAIVEDVRNEQISLTIFPDALNKLNKILNKKNIKFDVGIALNLSGYVNFYEDNIGIVLDEIYEVLPHPSKPKDLKPKKVSLKIEKGKNKTNILYPINDVEISSENEDALQEIENILYEKGLVELNDDSSFEDEYVF